MGVMKDEEVGELLHKALGFIANAKDTGALWPYAEEEIVALILKLVEERQRNYYETHQFICGHIQDKTLKESCLRYTLHDFHIDPDDYAKAKETK